MSAATGDTSSCASVGSDPVHGDVSSLVQVRQTCLLPLAIVTPASMPRPTAFAHALQSMHLCVNTRESPGGRHSYDILAQQA